MVPKLSSPLPVFTYKTILPPHLQKQRGMI